MRASTDAGPWPGGGGSGRKSAPAGGLRIAMLGPFGLRPKGTMSARAVPAAQALASAGHRVMVAMPPWHPPRETPRRWQEKGVAMEYVSVAGLGVPGLGHLWVARRLAAAARAWRADVVHVFKPKAYGALAADLLRLDFAGPRRPAIIIDTDDWEGPGGWNDLEAYGRLMRAFFARQERWSLVRAAGVTVASRALEGLVWSLGVPRQGVTYLPNAVAAVPLGGPRGSLPPLRPTLLLYTRFFEFDLEIPLAVLEVVRRRVPETRLLVAGRGLHGEEEPFAALAQRRGLGDAVRLVGWVEAEERPALFDQATVAIYPFDDTLVNRTKSPVKLLELLAAGLPVVAEGVGEIGEIIEDGVSGLVVAPGDVAAFGDAVATLVEDEARRAAMSAAARRRVAARFTWPERVADLEAAYMSALEGRRGEGRRPRSG